MDLSYLSQEALDKFIILALKEDVGTGDHSSLGSIPHDKKSAARLLVKADGIIAGLSLAKMIFHQVDPNLKVELLLKDGDQISTGDIGLTVSGKATSILTAERLALNCLQRMSGIATKTHHLNTLIQHTNARLLDTRKTTPNFRMLEKWAVVIGGGQNHRFGLFDMVMLKDNHVDFAGGIAQAIRSVKKYLREKELDLKIEVETRNLDEVRQVLEEDDIAVIMLDNFALDAMENAVRLINGKCKSEASGGITEATIREVAETGVDYISVGALTHSYQSLDMSLKAVD